MSGTACSRRVRKTPARWGPVMVAMPLLVREALFRTRTGDPFLTMEGPRRQPCAPLHIAAHEAPADGANRPTHHEAPIRTSRVAGVREVFATREPAA